jgi:cytochrome d ubiquinol oxidase subunit II
MFRRASGWLAAAASVAAVLFGARQALAGSFWPSMIPFFGVIKEAAAPRQSLTFMFYGAGLVFLPVVLIYTVAVYRIFRTASASTTST